MGCIARFGCLVMLALLAIGAWFTSDRWLHKVTGSSTASSTSGPLWEPLSPAAGSRGKQKIDNLANPTGPVFTNLSASEVASYVFQTAAGTLPTNAASAEAAVIGDALYVRAVLPVRDI